MKDSARLADWFPPEILGDELPLDAYWSAWVEFSTFAIPALLICVAAVIALVELGRRGADMLILTVLAILAALMIAWLVYSYAAYQKRVEDYDNRRQTRREVVTRLSIAVQNMIVNQVAVSGRNNVVSLNQTNGNGNVTATVLDTDATKLYGVALRIAEKAIASWNSAGGKRVRPKPFSAQVMARELGIGGETWQDAIALVNGAGVLHAGDHATAWRVMITNMKDAERALHQAMIERGYSSTWRNGEQSWYKVVPNTPALSQGT